MRTLGTSSKIFRFSLQNKTAKPCPPQGGCWPASREWPDRGANGVSERESPRAPSAQTHLSVLGKSVNSTLAGGCRPCCGPDLLGCPYIYQWLLEASLAGEGWVGQSCLWAHLGLAPSSSHTALTAKDRKVSCSTTPCWHQARIAT